MTKVDLIGIPAVHVVNKLNSARIPQFQYALMEQLYWSLSADNKLFWEVKPGEDCHSAYHPRGNHCCHAARSQDIVREH